MTFKTNLATSLLVLMVLPLAESGGSRVLRGRRGEGEGWTRGSLGRSRPSTPLGLATPVTVGSPKELPCRVHPAVMGLEGTAHPDAPDGKQGKQHRSK